MKLLEYIWIFSVFPSTNSENISEKILNKSKQNPETFRKNPEIHREISVIWKIYKGA